MKRWNLANKKVARAICVAMSIVMIMSMAGCGKKNTEDVQAALSETMDENASTLENVLNAQVTHSSTAGKEETVYVLAGANGAPNKVIVSDWLKNANGDSSLKDSSNLKDIQNVKGNEEFKTDADGNIVWNADGSDIYYQGTTDQEVPVSVKISYWLDGKEISPEELAGKDGKVTIRMDYENSATKTVKVGDEEEEIKVPFAMLSGMVLPEEHFSNIEVTNGRVLSEGNNSVVIGVAFPGLKESIDADGLKDTLKKADVKKKNDKTDELEIPDYLEVTADAKDFALDMTMTVAMSDILSDINLTDSLDLSGISDSMDELKNATTDLEDGTTQLKDGSGQLKDGADQLVEGTGKLADGAGTLKNGTQELYEKSGQLASGASQLNDGAERLDDGAGQLDDGAGALYDGTVKLKDGADSLSSGAGQLKDGSSRLAAGTDSLVAGLSQLDSGAAQLQAGTATLSTSMTQLTAQLPQMLQAATAVNNYVQGQGRATLGEANYNAVLQAARQRVSQQQASSQANLAASQVRLASANEQVQAAQAELCNALQTNTQQVEVVTDRHEETESQEVSLNVPLTTVYHTQSVSQVPVEGGSDEGEGATQIITDENGEEVEVPVDTGDSGDSAQPQTQTVVTTDTRTETEDTQVTQNVDVTREVLDTDMMEFETLDTDLVQQSVDNFQAALTEQAASQSDVNFYTVQLDDLESQAQTLDMLAANQIQMTPEQWGTLLMSSQGLVDGITQISQQLGSQESRDQLSALVNGSAKLAAGTNSALSGAKELNSGAAQLNGGLAELSSGANELSSGAGELKSGAADLKNGTSDLKNGTSTLRSGTSALKDGTDLLVAGTGSLNDGAGTLKDGIGTLQNGVLTLDDGMGSLDEGALELLEGMFKFDEEGISKLTDAFGSDSQKVIDRLQAVREAGKDYMTFTELPEGMDGSVKFVIKTDAVKAEK